MGIQAIIEKQCKQTAVYWGNPVNNGYGGFTYDDPIEIQCRWEDKSEIFTLNGGAQMVSKSIVFTVVDLSDNGILYLGTLADLDSYQEDNPLTVINAYTIKREDKSPALRSTTQFLRKYYLHNYGGL